MDPVITLIVTVALAFTGYLATYWNSLQLAKRKDRLDLVNRTLNEFYGPLYVACRAGEVAYEALLQKMGKPAIFRMGETPTQEAIAEWRVWLETVFEPLNDFREDLIMKNAHLIREEKVPDCLVKFVTHVSTLKAVQRKWAMGDFSEYAALIPFPADLVKYAEESYQELKAEQIALIGQAKPQR
jgi:hypothetical protein